jgi:ABC-type antimicrobial peptide transport system permease subunit
MFLRQGLGLTGIGLVVGFAAAIALGRSLSSLLFGVGPMDIVAYVASLSVTVAAATLASYVPARRAVTIDPMATLKAE